MAISDWMKPKYRDKDIARLFPELDMLPPAERRKLLQRIHSEGPWWLRNWAWIAAIPIGLGIFALGVAGWDRLNPGVPSKLWIGLGVGMIGLITFWPTTWMLGHAMRGRIRSRLPHLCSACGYDLTGNTSGVCPECGQEIEQKHVEKVE